MSLGKVIIFGDSYSTYRGHIPEGYDVYYSGNRKEQPDVSDVSLTWWHSLISETGSELVQNNSWSGSTIGFTGYNGSDNSKSSSFIYRLEKLLDEGFFEKNPVDTVFVFGGTNDNWAHAPLGELKFDGIEREELYSVLPAIGYFSKLLNDKLPKARKIFIINTLLKPEISEAFLALNKRFGFDVVALDSIDKLNGHPTEKGMKEIKNQILAAL